MSELTPAANQWLAAHHGIITSSELRTRGVGRSTVVRLVRADVLRVVHKCVDASVAAPRTLEQRCAAICAAHPDGFVTGPTAGMLLGCRRMPRTSAVHLSVRHGVHLPPDLGVRLRQTTAIPPFDRMARADGIVTASWARLAFDLAADLESLDHLSALQQMLHERHVTGAELVAIGVRLCHPGRRGSVRFAQSLERLDPSAPNESHPEVVLADALRTRGVPVVHQFQLRRGPNGRTARLDLAVPDVRWGVELDIHPEHRTVDGHAGDTRRYRDLHRIDWQIEPVSEADMARPDAFADELSKLSAIRCRQVAIEPSGT